MPGNSFPKLRYPSSKEVAGKGRVHIHLRTLPNRNKESGVNPSIWVAENFGTIAFRIGLIFIMSGILVGLVFSEWPPILLVGITFIVPEITRRLIEHRGDKQELAPDVLQLVQTNQEEM